ncbi:MAG TPA: class I SAM-dependent methyltransferase [Mycobacteriales bacterium]
MSATQAWADSLAAWTIPQAILDGAEDSPWVLPGEVFARRADRTIAAPSGATYDEAAAALTTPGTVLDVGAGAGAASLPLVGRVAVDAVTAVDPDPDLLARFGERASRLGVAARLLPGQWPESAGAAGTADVVVCANVLYNVPDLAPFVGALTDRARRRVVVEIAARHPLTSLNPLWQHFHGIARPEGPTAQDCLAALTELGIRPATTRWRRPAEREYATFAGMVEVTRRRLCLPRSAQGDLADVLRAGGVDPASPPDLGSSGREVVTMRWDGTGS